VSRIYLSPPDVGHEERELLLDAFDSNWIAPLGPHVDGFEAEFAAKVGAASAAALSSGTAALHLALLLAGVGPGDDVLVPSLTFVATANAVLYLRALPVFVDSEWPSWNIDPDLVAQEIERRSRAGKPPRAVIAVDLYGQCADFDRLRDACTHHGVALIEDAAEALGATYRGANAGTLGDIGVFSFNGNKIITTSGGGMLVTDDDAIAAHARALASQAREPAVHYEHHEVGFNYRMSNLLAAVGRAQLRKLDDKVSRRRQVFASYEEILGDLPGLTFMPEAVYGHATRWLTVALLDPREGPSRDDLISWLETNDVEARPAWKPMHQQPLFVDAEVVGGAVADQIFAQGICLPSGSQLEREDVERVGELVRRRWSASTAFTKDHDNATARS
jgi:dTDP-4-amino-4,6-dideoxygalactose transaminase